MTPPLPCKDISILAPAWGASPRDSEKMRVTAYFNSRPRVGGVMPEEVDGILKRKISILAPAWGASRNKARAYGG